VELFATVRSESGMIPVPSNTKVWIAVGITDNRRALNHRLGNHLTLEIAGEFLWPLFLPIE